MPLVTLGTYPLKGEELVRVINIAIQAGYKSFDTATAYDNEQNISALWDSGIKRENVFITSKVNVSVLKGRRRYLWLNKKSLKKAYFNSCYRLKVDYCDSYLLHQPFKGCMKAYKELWELYDAGKVRAVGVSNFNEEELQELYNFCGRYPMINQTEISPFNSQKSLVDFCKIHNIQVEAYSPFGRGLLVKELVNNPVLQSISIKHNKSVGQIVLRWIVQRGIVVVVRSSNRNRIIDNINIFDFELSEDDMKAIYSLDCKKVFSENQINKKTIKL